MTKRVSFEALGLCALVVSLTALGGGSVAQAQIGAAWPYEDGIGKSGVFNTALEAEPSIEIENRDAQLLIAGTGIGVLCTGVEVFEGLQLSSEGSLLSGRLDFLGCSLTVNGAVNQECETQDVLGLSGSIVTERVTGLIQLHTLAAINDGTVMFQPLLGTVLARIFTEEECPIAEEIIIEGKLVLWDAAGNTSFLTRKMTHLIQEFPGLKMMKVGIHSAVIDGTANVTLGGFHLFYLWGGKPA